MAGTESLLSFAPAVPASTSSAQSDPRRVRLDYLDGLRGLSALYVVLFHVWLEINWRLDGGGLPAAISHATQWMAYGRFAVAIFIVLSGYCLMLPVARAADGMLRGGAGAYLKRRARRILPPYYAALILSLVLIASVPGLRSATGSNWDWALPAFTPGVLLSHLLLVHNLSPAWSGKIDSPMWSVATEWQIYFVFPALLLPIWRRFGNAVLIAVAFALGLAPHFLLNRRFDEAAFWFLGLFAMGMAGAVVGFSRNPSALFWRERIPWDEVGGVLVLIFCAIAYFAPWWLGYTIYMDALLGAISVCLLIYCTRALTRPEPGARPLVLRLLEARWAVALGTFSYSLYLVHNPLLALMHLALSGLALSPVAQFAALLGLAVPLCVLIAYLFHLAFERRFMPGHPHTQSQTTKAASLSPAP